MLIYIMRHGQAAKPNDQSESQLTTEGRKSVSRQAQQLNQHLSRNDNNLSAVIHSGNKRAEETATIIHNLVAPYASITLQSGLLPNDDPRLILPLIKQLTLPMLIVGHLPFIPQLIALLSNGKTVKEQLNLAPGVIIVMSSSNLSWSLESIISPECD